MKTLLLFSFKRRVFNRISLVLHVLFTLILTLGIHFDYVSEWLNLGMHQPYRIAANTAFKEHIHQFDVWKQQGFEFATQSADIHINFEDGKYLVKADQDPILQRKIYDLILNNHKRLMLMHSDDSVYAWLERYETINIEFNNDEESTQSIKHQLIFVLLTSMYFMMLNFIAVNSNEIILEKISNVIPLFLSSITILQHYFIKLILGFSTILLQLASSVGLFTLLIYLRYRHDRFNGLLGLASKYLPIPADMISIEDILRWLDFSQRDIWTGLLALLFMILGIFTIQIIILVLSSKVKTMEEASSIQGPFYLLLLMLYYVALGLNQHEYARSIIVKVLSYLPMTSMMVMPIRLLSKTVFGYEIIISMMFAITFCLLILVLLFPVYRRGILDEG
jgi:ABC-2 type transport system permease protein